MRDAINLHNNLLPFIRILKSIGLVKGAVLCYVLITVLSVFQIFEVQGQHHLYVRHSTKAILVDGKLDEADWKNADSAHSFWQNFPYDTSYAETRTVVRMLSDEKYLYIAATCYDSMDGKYVITSLKRDFLYANSDAFSVYLNPFNDLTNGFCFTVNPYGVQSEGLIQNGGGFGVSNDWDNKWYSESQIFHGGYTVELAIPFKSIRFNRNDSFWQVNFSRNNMKRNENSCWRPVPRNLNVSTLVHTGKIFFERRPHKQNLNAALIPYAIATISQPDSRINDTRIKYNAGLDAKIVLTPSLNLDLTVNPDFAQVEVDRQVINLSRFSIFFPERRQFFLENSDLFANFGFRQIRPFFSRMIGLERGINIPIVYGARLSGKIGRQWRIGAMNIQTGGFLFEDGSRTPARNYSVAAFQRQVFRSSNIAGILVNRFDYNGGNPNTVAGLDYNLQSRNGKWLGKAFWHQSFGPASENSNFANATWLYYTVKKFSAMWNHEYVHRDYNASTGFVPRIHYYDMRRDTSVRLTYYRFEPEISYRWFPQSGKVNHVAFFLYGDIYRNDDFSENDAFLSQGTTLRLHSGASAGTTLNGFRTRLMYHTDVLGNASDTFYPGIYEYGGAEIFFQSNRRKMFSYYLSAYSGSFFNGSRRTFKTELNYRIQPRVVLGLLSTVDFIALPPENNSESKRSRVLQLIAPSFELSLNRKLFITTYVQYNSQADNININTRLQYRFRPMSDLFIVYSDNYYTSWTARNRGLTLKLIYWLNT